jgi:hypothetical protein
MIAALRNPRGRGQMLRSLRACDRLQVVEQLFARLIPVVGDRQQAVDDLRKSVETSAQRPPAAAATRRRAGRLSRRRIGLKRSRPASIWYSSTPIEYKSDR